MKWLAWNILEIGAGRVVGADRVRAISDLERRDRTQRDELAKTRRRIAARLARQRERGYRAGYERGRKEGMSAIANGFVSDTRRWADIDRRLRQAVDDALRRLGDELGLHGFLAAPLRRLRLVHEDASTWVVYANARTLSMARLDAGEFGSPDAGCRVLPVDYLADGVCLVETSDGVTELRAADEREIFLDAIRRTVIVEEGEGR